jgi:hypothetical protein
MGHQRHERGKGTIVKLTLLFLVVAIGCGTPTAPTSYPVPFFTASGTVERVGEHAWRVLILPGPDRDLLTAGECATLDYRLGDLRGQGVCQASVTTDLTEQPYLEVTVFVTRGQRVTSGVLGGPVPTHYRDIARLEVVLADQ